MTQYIIISGIDGSGKTSVINTLKEQLEQNGHSVTYIWMRYNHYCIKIMNAIARILKLSVLVHNAYGRVWEHRLYKSTLFCRLYVWSSYIDNIISKRKVTTLKTDYVICDRWINDILIDLGAECRFLDILDSKWYKKFYSILPMNSIQYVIVRNLKDIMDCRIENHTNPDFKYRYELYERLAKKENIHVINNCGTIENSIKQILVTLNEKN